MAPRAKNGPAPGVTRVLGQISIPYVSFKQNSGERFRAIWPSCFLVSMPKTYVVGIQKNCLIETVLLSTQNKCFN